MSDTAQKRSLQKYRSRLAERGLARFEVLARADDRALIRDLARRLMEAGPEATRLRQAVSQSLAGDATEKGGIARALRRSPLVGVDLTIDRPRDTGRKIDL